MAASRRERFRMFKVFTAPKCVCIKEFFASTEVISLGIYIFYDWILAVTHNKSDVRFT